MAEELIGDKGAVNTVAALIALATGQTSMKSVSLINSREVSLMIVSQCLPTLLVLIVMFFLNI